ncbi:muconolactone Delta-isomerase [Paraburkholderia unamae]|uniref:Muconolactone Delta-isomerase n=1 Tax=Paraburkholderia unamae TaxID=219649 RepID=A0ABX5KJA0_9BURK|nr:muconolactone Delta-isomerase [Paraburkholderia unamae]PVX81604.1 muconolactone delta-isomerase [Paraburkholderia unamae]RAR62682.1 muconolactone delta-isomerase [Paraburkholderia unamae]
MLYYVAMQINIPETLDAERVETIKAAERSRAIEIQETGKWPHLWRVVGQYANVSIFDVESNDELHQLLSSLPLFPYMSIQVTPLSRHPAAI